ncbi:hypothetical protein CDL12_18975 [Handroanthus impetiginosus]|uniref:Disease resistance N-terminal domain-containing protein n=1 Tax=Handroanthus impetiginosus TaxID=429701 RepID=A0A2G9GT47_9LAMI|nr:hypothetical protein CDL12_18975 [Handroanthus impetiginosus]
MAELAVDFLLQNLQRLQIHRPHLIREAENHVKMLKDNLPLFRDFLKDSIEKRLTEDESVRNLIRQINEFVYEAENIIDAVVSQAADSKTKKYFLRAFQTPAEKLLAIAKDVESGLEVRDIYGDRSTIDFAGVHINIDELEEVRFKLI